jgi:hypothetical protein
MLISKSAPKHGTSHNRDGHNYDVLVDGNETTSILFRVTRESWEAALAFLQSVHSLLIGLGRFQFSHVKSQVSAFQS